MGPALVEGFEVAGAEVIADYTIAASSEQVESIVAEAGTIDVLIANFAHPRPDKFSHELVDDDITPLFETMVYPLMRFGAAVLPQMLERQSGKLVLMGSAAPLKPFAKSAAYASARAAQLAWLKASAVEAAKDNVQLNAIAQNFVENPVYFSPEYQRSEEFKRRIQDVPAGRLGTAAEDVSLALFLASEQCNFISGASIPFTGGWAS